MVSIRNQSSLRRYTGGFRTGLNWQFWQFEQDLKRGIHLTRVEVKHSMFGNPNKRLHEREIFDAHSHTGSLLIDSPDNRNSNPNNDFCTFDCKKVWPARNWVTQMYGRPFPPTFKTKIYLKKIGNIRKKRVSSGDFPIWSCQLYGHRQECGISRYRGLWPLYLMQVAMAEMF